jgi:hypothetical protein
VITGTDVNLDGINNDRPSIAGDAYKFYRVCSAHRTLVQNAFSKRKTVAAGDRYVTIMLPGIRMKIR